MHTLSEQPKKHDHHVAKTPGQNMLPEKKKLSATGVNPNEIIPLDDQVFAEFSTMSFKVVRR